jgi:serine/threonine protein kinase
MHSENIWHRDIKPENLLISESTLKFIDFGISKRFIGDDKHFHTKNVVTRCYRPPEIFFGDRTYNGEAVDVWSAGCVFAEILTGSVLFPG